MPRILAGYDPCLDDYAKGYYNKPQVQKALHVSNGFQLKNWSICKYEYSFLQVFQKHLRVLRNLWLYGTTFCSMDVFYGWSQSKDSVLPIYKKLIDAKLRIWVYR